MLVGPSYYERNPVKHWFEFALDNDAYIAYRLQKPWNRTAWLEMLRFFTLPTRRPPMWALCPDVVGDREGTIRKWHEESPCIFKLGWQSAFAVQDGMDARDVPGEADLIFVGGTDAFKWRSMRMWVEHFPRVHVGRVNNIEKVWLCEDLGVESVDGTGWFRDPSRKDKLPALVTWLDDDRDTAQQDLGIWKREEEQ
jgi:hypothetical protein